MTSPQMLKRAVVWVIIVTTAASALIVDTDADAVVIVPVVITCVTTAGVLAFTILSPLPYVEVKLWHPN